MRFCGDGVQQVSDEGSRGRLELARLLARFRLARGLSQEELADQSGMSVRAIRNLEHGQVGRPHRSSIALLADALALTDAEHAAVKEAVVEADKHALASAEALPLASPRIAPSQLPPDIEDFTGRDLALHRLSSRLQGLGPGRTGVLITAVVGKAGVGKTTLAVHAAHRVRSLFPDGQLHVNLRGVEEHALDPTDVLGRFLRAFGLQDHTMPEDVDERAGLFRSLMADRRALVLLDNAADEAQVRPLLPAGVRNAVIITSRVRLAGLSPGEVIDLDVLPLELATELLGKIVGPDRVAREPEAAATIAAQCGNLPLALRIVGARLAGKPHWPLQRLTDRLGAENLRLDELAAGDLEVRASVAQSYRGLGVVERRAFRLLGLLDVPDVAPWMLSALLDVPAVEADNIMERLADAQLLDAIGEDASRQIRYRFHDLLRLFARERLAIEDTLGTQRAALERTVLSDTATAHGSVRQLRLRPADRAAQTASAPINGTETLVRVDGEHGAIRLDASRTAN
jgi:transcriptional regulator with XRE-family HTH domain